MRRAGGENVLLKQSRGHQINHLCLTCFVKQDLLRKVTTGVGFSIGHFTWNNGKGAVEARSTHSCLTAGSGFITHPSAETQIYYFIIIQMQSGGEDQTCL